MTRLAETKVERDRARLELSLYTCALQLVLTSQPDASCVLDRLAGESYTLQVYGSDRANGGTLIERFACTGQAESIRAYVFEDWARETRARVGYSPACTEFAIAAERLQLAIAARRKG